MIRKATVADCEAIVDINIKTWQTAYHQIFDQSVFIKRASEREIRVERLKRSVEESTVTQVMVAEIEQKVIGFILYGPDRDCVNEELDGEIYAIYILEAYQDKGIGKQLIHEAVKEMPYEKILIWALKDNPNTKVYENLGGINLHTKKITIGGCSYVELGYVFNKSNLFIRTQPKEEKYD